MDFGDGTWWNMFKIKLMTRRFTRQRSTKLGDTLSAALMEVP